MAQIKSEAAYRAAMKRIDELLKVVNDSTPADDPNYLELDMISDMVEEYEDVHYPISKPTLIDVIKLRLYEMGITQTKLAYVPEQETDFIFCTVGEEEGFVGCVTVLMLYFILIARLISLAERQRTPFAQVYGYCVACIFAFHVIINVGMVIGLVPVIGIPLPFFSYGGSGLWSFTILLFIFLKLDATRIQKY